MIKLFLIFFIMMHSHAYAINSYLNKHEEGWFWHKEPPKPRKKPLRKKPFAQNNQSNSVNHDKLWKLIGQRVEEARAKAILNPTTQNIAQARRYQRMVVAQSNLFSEKWMLDLLLNPSQDESLVNPTNSSARDLYNAQSVMEKEQAITLLRQSSGLFYFYKANEPYSERMAEVLHDFALSYQLPITPIAMSEKFSNQFPNSRVDSGEANMMGVKHIPAVFALHPASKQPIPIAYGLVSHSELKEHILLAIKEFQQGDDDAH